MDDLDRKLLNLLQTDFPVVPEPFAEIGKKLGITGDEVLARVRSLKGQGIIRQISAIFDSAALGYQSALAAFSVSTDSLEQAARIVSAHPGVSHNYERNHAYNLWFTITVPPGADPEFEVEKLAAEAKPTSARLFPTLRLFKIGVAFDMTGESAPLEVTGTVREKVDLDKSDILAIRALQMDLTLEPHPFNRLAEEFRMSEADLIARAKRFIETGAMRRYAAVLRHREAGFAANAMTAWNVPADRVEEVGLKMAAHPSVSHCYQRPIYPDWPYSIFTMIHGRTREDCEKVARELSEATGITDYVLLYSTREFKKTRVRYFEENERSVV